MRDRTSRILLVEDDLDIRDSIREVLELEDYDVVVAVDGRDALARLRDMEPPSLILLDLLMPGMSGIEFLAEIRKHADFNAVPVVLVSAWHEASDELKDQVQGFISKPIHVDALIQIAARFCSSKA